MYKSIDNIDIPVQFEWDETKRLSNLEKHGIDFRVVTRLFGNQSLTVPSPYSNEVRWITIGLVGDKLIVAVFTVRSGRIRLISARRAKRRERKEYYARYS